MLLQLLISVDEALNLLFQESPGKVQFGGIYFYIEEKIQSLYQGSAKLVVGTLQVGSGMGPEAHARYTVFSCLGEK